MYDKYDHFLLILYDFYFVPFFRVGFTGNHVAAAVFESKKFLKIRNEQKISLVLLYGVCQTSEKL